MEIVLRCVAIKAEIVEEDEFDNGRRRLLNFGHTAGHAIEAYSAFSISHGQGVAIGMVIAARAAARRGLCSGACVNEIESTLKTLGLPTASPYPTEALLESALSDKKRQGGKIAYIVPREIGYAETLELPVDEPARFPERGYGGTRMNVRVRPGLLHGAVAAIPSKSDAHRLLIAAALCDAPTHIELPSRSRDIDATAACLRALGADIQDEPGGMSVAPIKKRGESPQLDCGESGTTLRLLLPVAAALYKSAGVTGRGRLPERPLAELIRCLSAHGVQFSNDRLPLTLWGALCSGEYSIPGDVSSQYISGLLLALPLLAGDSSIRLTSPLESAGYVDMTLSALSRFGVRAQTKPDGFFVPGNQAYRSPGNVQAEGDWSNAAFFLAAGAIGKPVTCTGLTQNSAQPDRAILELLSPLRCGCEKARRHCNGIPRLR